jgi:hypothetical protein
MISHRELIARALACPLTSALRVPLAAPARLDRRAVPAVHARTARFRECV